MNKLEMAQEYVCKLIEQQGFHLYESDIERAFDIAEMMQAEAEKREDKSRPDVLQEWQPDWSQAPENAMYWAMDGCGQCNWYAREPEVCDNQWDFGRVIAQAHTGYDYNGKWQDSLRKRP